jgi:hypothetical protein
MVHKSCEGPARVMCLANSLPKKSTGLLSISLLCNIWRAFVWVLAHWVRMLEFHRITPHLVKVQP